MHQVAANYTPTLIIGIRTGGLLVAEAMARAAAAPLPVLPLTCRRATTGMKSHVPLLRSALSALPRPAIDMMRRLEHRWLIAPRRQRTVRQQIDRGEVGAVNDWLVARQSSERILVADDAIDSGATLATVLQQLRAICLAGTEIRSAVITQTLDEPVIKPDYVLFQGVLCRFPWSFDAAE
jgi:hypoxanthine phosphoribosyltransferase